MRGLRFRPWKEVEAPPGGAQEALPFSVVEQLSQRAQTPLGLRLRCAAGRTHGARGPADSAMELLFNGLQKWKSDIQRTPWRRVTIETLMTFLTTTISTFSHRLQKWKYSWQSRSVTASCPLEMDMSIHRQLSKHLNGDSGQSVC